MRHLYSRRRRLTEERTNGRFDCQAPGRPLMIAWNSAASVAVLFQPSCKRWSCPPCARANARWWRYVATFGAETLLGMGAPLTFITLTSHEAVRTLQQSKYVFSDAFPKLRKRMDRNTPGMAYIAIPEQCHDGTMHIHMISDAWFEKTWLKNAARECGLGYMVDIGQVMSVGAVSYYATKYLSKQLEIAVWPKHHRRIRHSRDWPKPDDPEQTLEWQFKKVKRNGYEMAHVNDLAERGYRIVAAGSYAAWEVVRSVG